MNIAHAPQRIIVGISGASGAVYGVRLLQVLRECPGAESHLVVSDAGWRTLRHELGMERPAVEALAHQAHDARDVGASIASGSFQCAGMVVAPCSMRTLASITHSLSDNLLTRAADVVLKERRRLVLMVRETPLHKGHLELMLRATDYGALILPPSPAFYHGHQTLDEVIDQTVGRALDCLGLPHELVPRWGPRA